MASIRHRALAALCWCAWMTSCQPVQSFELTFDPGAYLTAALPSELRRYSAEALEAERRIAGGAARLRVPQCPESNSTVGGTPCPPSKFRSATGECNNVKHRLWGRRGDVFLRLLPAKYEDSVSAIRNSSEGTSLPSIASAAKAAKAAAAPHDHPYVNSLLAAWGEMLLDDLASTGNAFKLRTKCCEGNSSEVCNSVCSEYARSAPGQDMDSCTFENREQLNLATGFLDGSALYGSTEKELRSIRLYDGGKLDLDACRKCKSKSPSAPVYRALLSEHNRIATALLTFNSHWDDNTLFLEARRALAATIQHITYTEFLDSVLGEIGMAKAELHPMTNGFYGGYSSSNRAGVFSEAAVSAFPVFQSMMHKSLYNTTSSIESLLATPARMPSVHIPTTEDSEDATADLIHKGRDHGLPSYPYYINLCERVIDAEVKDMTFDDLSKVGVNPNKQEILQNVYGKLSAVDLVVGAVMETPASGAVLGSTLACILTNQFGKLRISDRFWYENDLPPSSLSLDQLQAIRRVSMAGLVCTSTNIEEVQPKAFVTEDPYLNAPQSCSQHSHLDLSAWSDTKGREQELEQLSKDMIHSAVEKAKREMMTRKKLEYLLWEQSGGADPKSPVGTAASFSKANKQALQLANSSLFFEYATNEILNIVGQHRRRRRQVFENNILGFNPNSDFAEALQSVDVSNLLGSFGPSIEPNCDEQTSCDATTPFRTMTGHCNNLRNPNLGKSLTTFARLLPPVYEDGVSRPRISSVTGTPLPSPRVVSTLIHPDISNLHNRYTLMVMQFAQFLDHDLTMTPIHKGFHESIPNCRSCDSPRTVHPECSPFPVPRGDHYYPEVNVTSGERLCFPFMRSLPGQQHLGPREQVNQNTAFLDASAVYGENPCVLNKLRGFSGRMNATDHPVRGRELLPRSDSHPECKTASGYCFIAGDGRASEQPGLTAIHTILLREHNRIVEGLRGVNPHWSGDLLFDHARRILSAQFQHMTYNEFLPRILSWNAVNLYGLKLLPTGYYKEYSPTCNPSIVNEFAAAAYRIGHSMLRPHLPRMSPSYQPIEPPILLRDGFFKVDMFLQPSMTEELLRGLVSTPMETLDQFITGEVTNHLFEDRRIPFSGIDLIALNIQRARDHGIPSYNNYRALCNLKRAASFDDLSREIPPEVISRFKRIYPTVDDIDLFPGGMSERPLQGGLVGPTFACIIAIQFRQLRKCDRFWYENEDPALRFSEAQLGEIRKVTLSKILCENFDIHSDMQRAAFDLPSNFLNPRVPCHSLPQMDLSAWRETSSQGCHIAGRNVRVGESAFPSPCTSCICTDEGAQCASLRITDCNQLAREWARDVILRDDVCAAQCGGLLGGERGSRSNPGLLPPPRRTRNRGSNAPFNGPFGL